MYKFLFVAFLSLFTYSAFAQEVALSDETEIEPATETAVPSQADEYAMNLCKQACRADRKICLDSSACQGTFQVCFQACDRNDPACKKQCTAERNKCAKDSGCYEKSKTCFKACKNAK